MAHSALVRASRIGDAEATPLYPPGQKPPERHPAGTAGFPGISRQSGGWPKSNVFGQSGLATFCVHLLREGQVRRSMIGADAALVLAETHLHRPGRAPRPCPG